MTNITNIRQFGKTSLREQVTHALRAAIISGELEPGAVYSAPALGARFGVSATPVREAMLDLVRENLVTTVPNKGYRVTSMDEGDLDEITELRMLAIVEGAVAGDLVAYTDADRAFHLHLLGYAGNRRALSLVADLRAHTRLYGLAGLLDRGELEGSAHEHHQILDAVEARDAARAEQLMRVHIGHVRGAWAGAEPSRRR
jgi:DNA-binding GntR family transcriptional regulator